MMTIYCAENNRVSLTAVNMNEVPLFAGRSRLVVNKIALALCGHLQSGRSVHILGAARLYLL